MKVNNNHVRVLTDDFSASFRFYRDVLDLTPTFGSESETYAAFDGGGENNIALFIRSGMDEAMGRASAPLTADQPDRTVLCIGVDNVDDAYAELQSKGVQFVTAPTDRPDWGVRTLHFRDPSGNLIEIEQNIQMSE